MSGCGFRKLISILMESPLYQTLSIRERYSLMIDLGESYPSLVDAPVEEMHVGYESSWTGIIATGQDHKNY